MKDMKDITAAVTACKGADFELKELKIRAPEGDEVLVKVIATGMCHTDLIVRDQYYQFRCQQCLVTKDQVLSML